MTAPSKIRTYVKLAIQNSGEFDEVKSYITHEADPDGTDGNLRLPLIEIEQIDFEEDNRVNSLRSGTVTDQNGNTTGYAYEMLYDVTIQINLWVADGSDYNVDRLGNRLRKVLFEYDVRGPSRSFVDEEGREIDTIFNTRLLNSTRDDDTGQNPTVRKWSQTLSISACEIYSEEAEGTPASTATTDIQPQ